MNFDSLKSTLQHPHAFLEMTTWIVIAVVAGVFIGIATELILKEYGNRLALMTKWKFDDFLIRSIRGTLLPLCIVIALCISVHAIPDLKSTQIFFDKTCFAITAFLITLIIARFSSKMIRHFSSTAAAPLPSTFLSNLTSVIVFIIGTLVTLQTFGISITPILTTLGIGGLAVALALQDTLANLFSGLYILLSKQVRLGDYVKLDSGNEGYISDITWRNTVIRTLSNNFIIIPNIKLSSALITNFNLPVKEVTFHLDIGIGYESDLSKVEKITQETVKDVLKSIPGGVTTFEPLVRFHTFGPSSIIFTIIMKANEYVDQYHLKHECIKSLHKKYTEDGIVIPFPIQTVHLKSTV